jgi:hypothetical protein
MYQPAVAQAKKLGESAYFRDFYGKFARQP